MSWDGRNCIGRKKLACFLPKFRGEPKNGCGLGRKERNRIHAALPQGAAALTCTMFFDEINRDEKGFNTGDGAIVVGGVFRARARESTDAKVSFGTFPKVRFPACNRDLDKAKLFLKRLRHSQLNAIYGCFTRFNSRGGAVVPCK